MKLHSTPSHLPSHHIPHHSHCWRSILTLSFPPETALTSFRSPSLVSSSCLPSTYCFRSSSSHLPPRKTAPAVFTPSLQAWEPLMPPRGVRQHPLRVDRKLGTDSRRIGQWCTSQRNTCADLCGGPTFTARRTCDDVSVPVATSSCTSTSRGPASSRIQFQSYLSKHLLILLLTSPDHASLELYL